MAFSAWKRDEAYIKMEELRAKKGSYFVDELHDMDDHFSVSAVLLVQNGHQVAEGLSICMINS